MNLLLMKQEAPNGRRHANMRLRCLSGWRWAFNLAAFREVLGGHVSDGGQEEQPHASRRMVQVLVGLNMRGRGRTQSIDPGAANPPRSRA